MKIKAFQRLFWKSDIGGYFDVEFPGNKEIILYLGPIIMWLHR